MTSATPLATTWSSHRRITRRGVLWLGLRCDVRCKFCYDGLVDSREKMWISVREATRLLDKFRFFYANEFVDLMGGEPTLHPEVLEIVAYAARIGLRPTVITHGMRLAELDRARAYQRAGIHDFLISVHGVGETVAAIHLRGKDNFARQLAALDNLRALGIPFRFNVTMIRDNLTELTAIVGLAATKGARVVNFLTFNPYFEWSRDPEIPFQVRHSELAPYLAEAIDRCVESGIEVNVRYLPLCQLPGREAYVYTGFQLPYDPHEWDYNSWYDVGQRGSPDPEWYAEASRHQRRRHGYRLVAACSGCALRQVCDGFHTQYVTRWGGNEANPYTGPLVTDPCYFVRHQPKLDYRVPTPSEDVVVAEQSSQVLGAVQRPLGDDGRAGVRRTHSTR